MSTADREERLYLGDITQTYTLCPRDTRCGHWHKGRCEAYGDPDPARCTVYRASETFTLADQVQNLLRAVERLSSRLDEQRRMIADRLDDLQHRVARLEEAHDAEVRARLEGGR